MQEAQDSRKCVRLTIHQMPDRSNIIMLLLPCEVLRAGGGETIIS